MKPVVERLKLAMVLDTETNDPILASSENRTQVIYMYEDLVRYDALGQLVPMLAESWEVSSDARTWTYNLRKGVQFHRGFGEFTAKDVVATLEHEAREESTSTRKTMYAEDVIPDLQVVDDYKIVITLDNPTTNLHWIMSNRNTTFILSKAHLDSEGQEGVEAGPVGTGPYRFLGRSSGAFVLHETVPWEHWRITPDFRQVQLFNVKEVSTRQAMLLAGEVHMTQLSPDLERAAVANGMVTIESKIPVRMPYLMFGGQYYPDKFVGKRTGEFPDLPFSDTFHPATEVPWVNKKVREALNRAVDRKTIQETILGGSGGLLYNFPFHPNLRGWNPAWEANFEDKYGYDPVRAKELLKEAEAEIGQPLDWSKVTFVIGPSSDFPVGIDVTQAIYNYWEAIGVPVKTEIIENASRGPIHRTGTWGGAVWMDAASWREEPSSIQIYAYSGRTLRNFCCHFFENETVDTLFEQLAPETDLEERAKLLSGIGNVIYEEYAFMPLFTLPQVFTVDPSVIADYATSGVEGMRDIEDIVAVKK
jgi:peptide/nickel transport system substrate-binding protein